MRHTSSLTKQYAHDMTASYAANDPVSFTAAAMALKDVALKAIAEGFHGEGAGALTLFSERMGQVKGKVPEGSLDTHGVCTAEFASAVMPLFGVNSTETANNLGISDEIDRYLMSKKIRFSEITYGWKFSTLMFHSLRLGMIDEFIEGYTGVCDELSRLQDLEFKIKGADTGESSSYGVQHTLLNVFGKLYKYGIDSQNLSTIDEALAAVLNRLCHGNGGGLPTGHAVIMRDAGIRRSLMSALKNVYSVSFDLESFGVKPATPEEAAYILGLNCHKFHGPLLIKNLIGVDPETVRKAMHAMSHKSSACDPKNLMLSCKDYIESDDYRGEHLAVLNVLLENAWAKLKKSYRPKAGEASYEGFRKAMTDAGIPDRIQFKLPMLRANKVKLLESEMGL
jgi:hypothetical protein